MTGSNSWDPRSNWNRNRKGIEPGLEFISWIIGNLSAQTRVVYLFWKTIIDVVYYIIMYFRLRYILYKNSTSRLMRLY